LNIPSFIKEIKNYLSTLSVPNLNLERKDLY
jgi:hypothetical protein